jgi:hypothetical protein
VASVNEDVLVNEVSLFFVNAKSVCAFTSGPGAKLASCHVIELPFQPEDVERPYAPKSP